MISSVAPSVYNFINEPGWHYFGGISTVVDLTKAEQLLISFIRVLLLFLGQNETVL